MKEFIEETVAKLPEEERDCARSFMEWFDDHIASREMMKTDPRGWAIVEQKMWEGWRGAWPVAWMRGHTQGTTDAGKIMDMLGKKAPHKL
jgi:hypothetical protein